MRKSLALLAVMAGTPVLAADTETTLPTLAITASRVPTPLERIPAGVTVITRQQIEDTGFNTLTEALAGIPGMRTSPAGGPGGQASLFIRGTNSNHVLVLRDGMPINDPSEATGAFNFGVDTLSDIERIEVIRGPMAALYGSGAIGGVINMISRRGRGDGPTLEGDLALGLPEQIRGGVVASGVSGPIDYAITAGTQSLRGHDAIPQRMSIYSGTPQGFRDRVGTVHLGWTPVEGTRLSLFLRGRQALFGFNNLGFPTWDTANASGSAESLLARAGVTSELLDGLWQTSLHVGHLRDGRHYRQYLDPLDPNQASGDSRYNAARTDFQWNNTIQLGTVLQSPVVADAALTFGYQHTVDTIRVTASSVSSGFPFDQRADAAMITNAMHLGAQATLWDRIDLSAQVRQDWVAGSAPTTWRVGGIFRVPEMLTNIKLAYGTAFRAPSLFDRFGVDSFGYVGNPNLRPEHAQGWEAGFTTTLPALGRKAFATLGASYFNQQVQNLITTQFTPVYTSVNIGSAHVQGVEAELTLRPTDWLTIRTTYTYTDTLAIGADAATGSRLLRRPPHTGSVDMTIIPVPGLSIVPRLVYSGSFRDFLYDDAGFPTTFGTSPGGTVMNIAINYDLTERIRVYVNAWNVLYSRFEPVNGFQTPGPSGVLGIRVRL